MVVGIICLASVPRGHRYSDGNGDAYAMPNGARPPPSNNELGRVAPPNLARGRIQADQCLRRRPRPHCWGVCGLWGGEVGIASRRLGCGQDLALGALAAWSRRRTVRCHMMWELPLIAAVL